MPTPHDDPERRDMPSATRRRLDERIHRQRVALRENWLIVERRHWYRHVRPDNRHLAAALRLLKENGDLKARLTAAEKALSSMREA